MQYFFGALFVGAMLGLVVLMLPRPKPDEHATHLGI